jgi:hypothetical protein
MSLLSIGSLFCTRNIKAQEINLGTLHGVIVVYSGSSIQDYGGIYTGMKICGGRNGIAFLRDVKRRGDLATVPVSFSELYTAMQTGVCEGAVFVGRTLYDAMTFAERVFGSEQIKFISIP